MNDYEWTENEPMVCFYCDEEGDAFVFRRCPLCGRFITVGTFQINGMGQARFVGWRCSKHGEVEPGWIWGDY